MPLTYAKRGLAWAAMLLSLALCASGCASEGQSPYYRIESPGGRRVFQSAKYFPQLPPEPDPSIPGGAILLRKYPGSYAAFKLESADARIVVMDPCAMDEGLAADAVCLSHSHLDHADFARIAPGGLILDGPGSASAKGISFRGFAGVHDEGDKGRTNVMRLIVMDGMRVLHLGSQAEIPSDEALAEMGAVDVLIIQVYPPGNRKLVIGQAKTIALALRAKVIVPAHGEPKLNRDIAAALGADFRKAGSGRLIVDRALLDSADRPIVVDMDNAPR